MNKVIKIVLLILCLLIILPSIIFASTTTDDIVKQAQDFEELGKEEAKKGQTMDTSNLNSASSVIYNILLGVGTAVAIIVGAILGIQYMTAGIDKKVEVKESLIPYLISCIVLFGSLGIWKLMVTILGDI